MAPFAIMAVASGMPQSQAVPLASESAHAGFPSPAADHMDSGLNLDQRFIRNHLSTFIVRAAGDSLQGAGIYSGDYLVVDRSRAPRDGDYVIAVVDGGFAAKRFSQRNGVIQLVSANAKYAAIPWQEGCEIWGVVTSVHRDLLG